MANVLGNQSSGGFFESVIADLNVMAQKFTNSGSTFTPISFNIGFFEGWGTTGTLYLAIYNDDGNIHDPLWTGSVSYTSLQQNLVTVPINSGPAIQSGQSYWLCWYTVVDSGSNISGVNTSFSSGADIRTWTASSAGAWANNPPTTSKVTDEIMQIWITDTNTVTKTHTTNALKKAVGLTKTHTANSLIKKIGNTVSHSTDALLNALIGIPTWVSPADGASVLTSQTPLVFTMPTTQYDLHFEIQADTVNTFDSGNLKIYKSWISQTGWEYHNGTTWVALPADGVPLANAGNQVRYTPTDLVAGTWYRRVRGRGRKTS